MVAQTSRTARRQARIAAIVICATVVLWLGASWIGGRIGLPIRWAFLFDLAAMAAFAWALFVLFQVWRGGRQTKD